MTAEPQALPLGPLIQGAFDRVRFAIPYHAALAYAYLLPIFLLLIPGLMDDVLATLISRQAVGNVMAQSLLLLLPLLLWSAIMMVLWYRLTLLGPAEFLRIDSRTGLNRALRFLGVALVVGALTAAAFLAAAMVVSLVLMPISKNLLPVGMILAVLAALFVTLRFLPSLAAVPLGRHIPLRAAWDISRGHGWPLLLAALALVLPAVLVSGLVEGLLGTLVLGAPPGAEAALADKIAHLRGTLWISFFCAPLSCAANAFLCGLGAEIYIRLVGTPLDVRGMEV